MLESIVTSLCSWLACQPQPPLCKLLQLEQSPACTQERATALFFCLCCCPLRNTAGKGFQKACGAAELKSHVSCALQADSPANQVRQPSLTCAQLLLTKRVACAEGQAQGWEPGHALGGHYGAVVDMCWGVDGSCLLTASTDQTCRITVQNDGVWSELARPQVTPTSSVRPSVDG